VLRSRPRAAPATDRLELDYFAFSDFIEAYGRDFVIGSQEYARRAALFQTSMTELRELSARNHRQGRLWTAGVHPFMDWTQAERNSLNGYKPPARRGVHERMRGRVLLLHTAKALNKEMVNATRRGNDFSGDLGISRHLQFDSGPAVRNQGNCGSCWAISAVEAVEAHLLRRGGSRVRLSAQALLDCVPNPQHCGGTGGCDGGTGELAYAFMRDHGIPLESAFPYRARTQRCPRPFTSEGLWQSPSRARIDGWASLPSNELAPFMQALVEEGPVVVAVDGSSWSYYRRGIFDVCEKNAILGHAVLAKGFGEESGNKYWLIQNSWGEAWGERGHIRLLRRSDEETWCGIDNRPQEGVGCDGGPAEVTVCGACGVLYDPIVPTGVRLETA